MSGLGVAVEFDAETGIEGDLPGQGGHDPVAVGSELRALLLEDGPAGSIENADLQSVGGKFEPGALSFFSFVLLVQDLDEVLAQAAKHGQFDGRRGVEVARPI